MKDEFPLLADRIKIENQGANKFIQDLCNKDWIQTKRRAVMFLDPYGMQVRWETIEAIAKTQAIDLWLLFPLGVAVNRLLRKDGKITPKIRERLNDMFGTDDWQNYFFKENPQPNMFEKETGMIKQVNMEQIAKFFNQQLEGIFEKVANNPLYLRNSKNNPLYLLCFASGNPKGATPAVRIAQHILKGKK